MQLVILLACCSFVAAKTGAECKTCVKVDSVCRNNTFLFNLDAPFRETVVITQLGIREKNLLYFAFEPNISDPEYYKVGYVDINTKSKVSKVGRIIEGSKPVCNFRTFAFDDKTVYLGGGDGIYALNSDKAALYSSSGDTIVSMTFYKNHLNFVVNGTIIEKEGDNFRPMEQYKTVKNFVYSKNDVLVYMNDTGLYASRNTKNTNTKETVYLSKNNFFRGLTVDRDANNVYAWWIDGIYKVNIENDFKDSTIVKVADIESIGALTFDEYNNFIYSSNRGLYNLTKSTDSTLC